MKFILLAAAAMIATPLAAQTMPQTGGNTPDAATPSTPPTDQTTPAPDTTTPPAAMPDSAMPAQTTATPQADTMTSPAPATNTAGDPVGGYQPAGPPMAGMPATGARVVFQPSQSPDQAYPAPAPMAKYPVCKKGQFDDCIQGRAPPTRARCAVAARRLPPRLRVIAR